MNDSHRAVFATAFIASASACTVSENTEQSTNNAPAYVIELSDTTPAQASVRLTLPKNSGAPTEWKLYSRAAQMNVNSQVQDVRCDDARIAKADDDSWPVPAGCAVINWTVDFVSSAETSPGDQQSAVMPSGWRVFSSPSSLLRLSPAPSALATVTIIDKKSPPTIRKLPADSAPPAYFVIGAAPLLRAAANDVTLNYAGEDLETVTAYVSPQEHLKGIEYFKSILGEEKSRETPELTVVWYGVSRERHEISGAAGYDTMLANYILEQDNPSAAEFYRPFVLVLHEQFHQISLLPAPIWAGESLAQYFALKAAKKILPEIAAVQEIYAQEINGPLDAGPGLLTIQQQIMNGDYRNYSLLYTRGAKFWSAIDTAIANASGGAASLDDYLPAIGALDIDAKATELPVAFFNALSIVDESELKALASAYL